jgi:hypothetical protein
MEHIIKKILREQIQEIEKQSNFSRLLDKFKETFPEELKPKFETIKNYVESYIKDHGFNVKFLNSCSTGFAGVRTKNQIIICSPNNMTTFGDFLYTIFHEIRHEEQMSKMKMRNPLSDFDLNDFEELYKHYWDLEMDADKFGKEMVAKLIVKLNIPIEIAKPLFSLSTYIQLYPFLSKQIEHSVRMLVNQIKQMKSSGEEYEDIQDHPIVKRHLDKLEEFI